MAVRTASKSRAALGRRPMPTNAIPLAGIAAPRQFISISPRFPNAGMGQMETHVNHSWRPFNSLSSSKSFVGPSAEGCGKCAGANDGPLAWENQRSATGNKATMRICCRSAYRRFDKDVSGVSTLQHFHKLVPPTLRKV